LSKYVCFVTFFFVEYVRTSESSEWWKIGPN
jgi:hypothetical protein